jgi:hypothetical protein
MSARTAAHRQIDLRLIYLITSQPAGTFSRGEDSLSDALSPKGWDN